MRKTIVILTLLIIYTALPVAAYEKGRARTNFAHELAECAAYFVVSSNAPGLGEALKNKLSSIGQNLLVLSANLTSQELALARLELAVKIMKEEIKSNWENMSILNNKYGFDCKKVKNNPEDRLKYWLNKKD